MLPGPFGPLELVTVSVLSCFQVVSDIIFMFLIKLWVNFHILGIKRHSEAKDIRLVEIDENRGF